MNLNLVIRQATLNDIPILTQMRWEMTVEQGTVQSNAEIYQSYSEAFAHFLSNHLERDECQIWMVLDGNIPIANATLWLFPELPWGGGLNNWHGYVSNFYTIPAYRNHGIGSRLMEAIRQVAIAYGAKDLILEATDDSSGIYERMGFQPSQMLRLSLMG